MRTVVIWRGGKTMDGVTLMRNSHNKIFPLWLPRPAVTGADFFDTFQGGVSSKPKEKDYFADFGFTGVKSSTASKKEKTPPPLVSAALFGGGEKKTETASDGWGDWESDFNSPKPQVKHVVNEIPALRKTSFWHEIDKQNVTCIHQVQPCTDPGSPSLYLLAYVHNFFLLNNT